jgi:hypothetical protein
VQAPSARFYRPAQGNSKLIVVRIIVAKMMPDGGLRQFPARRQSRKLLLSDLTIGFDRGEIGARLIRLPQR